MFELVRGVEFFPFPRKTSRTAGNDRVRARQPALRTAGTVVAVPIGSAARWRGRFVRRPRWSSGEAMEVDTRTTPVEVPVAGRVLLGDLGYVPGARGLVIFAHGSGSSRHSPRNRLVARQLERRGHATLLVDLLTAAEEVLDERTGWYRFDAEMLAERLGTVMAWARLRPELAPLRIGLFGASTGGGAALIAAARHPSDVSAVVSRGGRPDLAGEALQNVVAPTLLIVGASDDIVLRLNRDAMRRMRGPVELVVVPGATHLFEEPGALEQVAEFAAAWFDRHLGATAEPSCLGA